MGAIQQEQRIAAGGQQSARQATSALASHGLQVVHDYNDAEALVRGGIDSALVVVSPAEDAAQAAATAQAGLAEDRGPIPLRPYASGRRCLVVMPTYDEAENLEAIVHDIHSYLETDILIIDDGSPDGTGQIADRLAAADNRIHVIHRAGKQGLGTAYLAGFAFADEHDYERVFEMDADFSHPPWDLPRLVAAAESADLVIGSRYVRGGSTIGWDLKRRCLSKGANLYARLMLGTGVRDMTAGYRCYHVDLLRRMPLEQINAQGYAFQIEMVYRVRRAGGHIREIPIHFTDRRVGQSKMDSGIAREALWLVPALRFRRSAPSKMAPSKMAPSKEGNQGIITQRAKGQG